MVQLVGTGNRRGDGQGFSEHTKITAEKVRLG